MCPLHIVNRIFIKTKVIEIIMTNPEKVRKYREDLCIALDLDPQSIDLEGEYFEGTFYGQQLDYLDSIGLINRGFCPLCGTEPISNDYHRGFRFSKVRQFLCEECYKRTFIGVNELEKMHPGYKRRLYTYKAIKWIIIIIILYIVIKSCI